DDVMRLLWQRFGRGFYQGGGLGIAEDAMPGLILEATGIDTRDFIERYAYGREDVPLDQLLPLQGIKMDWKVPSAAPALDARLHTSHGGTQIATVYEGGCAHAAGLSAGDTLLAINGLRVTDTASAERLLSAY